MGSVWLAKSGVNTIRFSALMIPAIAASISLSYGSETSPMSSGLNSVAQPIASGFRKNVICP
jgi:hypothetical protein